VSLIKKIKNTLVLLSYNEIDALKLLHDWIPFDSADEVFAIDPGSTDGTLEFYKKKGIKYHLQKELGRGKAFVEALKHAKGKNIVFFSTDGNEDPKDIPKLFHYLEKGYDLVIAGRFIHKDSKSDDSDDPLRIRKACNIMCSGLANIIWNTGAYDAINGFRGLKKDAMIRMNLDAPKHEIEYQTTIRAAKLGMKIKEIPTHELERLGGLRKPTAGTLVLAKAFTKFFVKELMTGKSFQKESRKP